MDKITPYVEDRMLKFDEAITGERIQNYLTKINSWLKGMTAEGKPFAYFLQDLCRQHGVNQIWMLATVQKEQSALFRATPPPDRVINKILGYGIMETGTLPGYAGFEKQFKSAIKQFSKYDSWGQVVNYDTYVVKLYDDAEDRAELKQKGIKFTGSYIAGNKAEAKALLYTPRLAPLVQMGELFKEIEGVI